MHTVGLSFAWEFWGRHRWLIGPTLAYLFALVLMINLAPVGTFTPPIIVELSMPLWPAILVLIAIFSYGDRGDLLARESGYPHRAFTLPVRTAALVAWPLALGAAFVGSLWLVLAGWVLQQGWPECPVVWPAVFLAGFVSWTQALTWLPFPLPALRVLVTAPVLSLLVAGAILGGIYGLPPELLIAISLGLFVVGYGLAVVGVARARRGDVPVRSWPNLRGWLPARGADRAAFRSPHAALAWLEWRSNLFLLPLLVVLILVPLLNLIFVSRPELTPNALLLLPAVVSCPLLIAFMSGAALGNCHGSGQRNSAIPVFLAGRPVTTGTMVAVKLRSAVAATSVIWLITGIGLLAILPLCPLGTRLLQGFDALHERIGIVRASAMVLLLAGGLPALTWKLMIDMMWMTLIGRYWVSVAVNIMILAGVTALAMVFARAESDDSFAEVIVAAVPWLVGVGTVLKLGGGVLVAWGLLRRGLVERRTLILLATAWAAGAAVIVLLAYWLMPADIYSPLVVGAAAVVLCLPMVRLGLAPLALDWNRHR
jgi:hypothetical protein